MEQYPSILGWNSKEFRNGQALIGKPFIAFNKYDGSNLRWEWTPKQGWNKFGTRRQLFDSSTELYNQAIPLFMNGLADEIVYRTKHAVKNPQRITAFTEFFGPSSIAGTHVLNESKELRLFDVYLFKQGLMKPKQFVKTYGDLSQAAEVLAEGEFTTQFALDVYFGKCPVNEGMILKGEDFMAKVKTEAWYNEVRRRHLQAD